MVVIFTNSRDVVIFYRKQSNFVENIVTISSLLCCCYICLLAYCKPEATRWHRTKGWSYHLTKQHKEERLPGFRTILVLTGRREISLFGTILPPTDLLARAHSTARILRVGLGHRHGANSSTACSLVSPSKALTNVV